MSNDLDVLVVGVRCPLLGKITMHQNLIDVTALRCQLAPGAEVMLISGPGEHVIEADDWAKRLGTTNYGNVTGISRRVPRAVVVGG